MVRIKKITPVLRRRGSDIFENGAVRYAYCPLQAADKTSSGAGSRGGADCGGDCGRETEAVTLRSLGINSLIK